MKKVTLFFVIAVVINLNNVRAQDSWVQKADFGGIARYNAAGFSIGNKGYVGTGGYDSSVNFQFVTKDFWEYDPISDTWTQKADFGGVARRWAVGFSIGDKGYIGTGRSGGLGNGTSYKDVWEYNPDTNTWTQIADFGGAARWGAVGFVINNKGYIGTGMDLNFTRRKDLWEYDPDSNVWQQKADFGGTVRYLAVGFSINNKGYIGTGFYVSYIKDFWEYDPTLNSWIQKADFGGLAIDNAVGFSISSKGYIGTGDYVGGFVKSFWEYDPQTNVWTQKTDCSGKTRAGAVGFSIGTKGYVGTGYNFLGERKDFWEYTPDIGNCLVPSNLRSKKITSTSAQLRWDSVAGAEKYKLRYKVANTNDWVILNPVGHKKDITVLLPNTTYVWQVRTYCQVDSPTLLSQWSAKEEFTTLPLRMSEQPSPQPSFQLYPNPAKDYATIQYTLKESSNVSIKVYDASGKEIKTVLDNDADQGTHTLPLNIKDFPSGIYFVKMISDFGIETQKLMVQ